MERIVDRDLLRGVPGGGYDFVRRDLGNGHHEYRIQELVTWEHVDVLSDEAYAAYLEQREATAEERRQANLERAAKRAKTRVRHLCKASGVDTLLTLTYRANMVDRELLKRHVKEFNRRMKRLIPGFFYVAAYEQQERGAWHVHMAVHRLPRELQARPGVKVKSFNVVRAVWRAVVGELGGNIDVSAHKRNSKRAPSKVAAYLSKYMVKAFADGDAWSNRFSSSKGVTVPKPERMRFVGYSLCEVLELVFNDLPHYVSDQLTWGMGRFKDCVWLMIDRNIRIPGLAALDGVPCDEFGNLA
ncbi:rolling circle replication-associated protein [Hydrogenophaga aquatica]